MTKKTPVISTKRIAISKANAQIVGIVGGAAFLTIFCLFAAKAAWNVNRYEAKIISAKEKANTQLEDNITAYSKLKISYNKFDGASKNVIGGDSKGTGDSDGYNSQIVLDALPSSYDFPALASSLEKILTQKQLSIAGISGTDDQVAQQANTSSDAPKPVSIPFTVSIDNATYGSLQTLTDALQNSIRPIQIDTLNVTGSSGSMQVSVTAHTYYQPARNLDIKKQAVK